MIRYSAALKWIKEKLKSLDWQIKQSISVHKALNSRDDADMQRMKN